MEDVQAWKSFLNEKAVLVLVDKDKSVFATMCARGFQNRAFDLAILKANARIVDVCNELVY